MQDLQRLIQKKSKKFSSFHGREEGSEPRKSESDGGNGRVVEMSKPVFRCEKGKTKSNGRVATYHNVEQFLLNGSGSIEMDIVLNPAECVVVNRYLIKLGLPGKIYGESDYERVIRCRNAVEQKMSGRSRDTGGSLHTDMRAPHTDSRASIDEAWANLQVSLEQAGSVKTFYKWMRLVFTGWFLNLKSELGEPVSEESHRAARFGCSMFVESCIAIRVLISDLQSDSVTAELRDNLEAIADMTLHGDFVGAEEEYMKIAVGRQAWLIGVGNCFIQERSSLDRIRDAKHIMNDERFRNYVQCIKRLITMSKHSRLGTK